jgi:hypothetical protein
MSGAASALQAAAMAALDGVEGLTGVYAGPPVQAALPYALVQCGIESDWSHKSGRGREMRLAITVKAGGERPGEAQRLAEAAEAAIEGGIEAQGWAVASLRFVRRICVSEGGSGERRWAVLVEFRARMLEAE